MAAWLLMFIARNPEWKAKIQGEVQSFVMKYAPEPSKNGNDNDQLKSLADQLSKIPASVWEEEMTLTDLCLRETIRLVQSSVFLRRNMTPHSEVDVGGHKVKFGDFVVYPSADVHHNAAIYESPQKFDPTRHLESKDENGQKTKLPPFVGWGAGRHPCLGMRFAKLEVKWIVAM